MGSSTTALPPDDRRKLSTRLSALQAIVASAFAALAVAFWIFQVAQHQKFDEMAENNHRRRLPLPAPRGVVFDRNGFLARPDPVGSFTPHEVEAVYLGWTSFGHAGRINIDHALYFATGARLFVPGSAAHAPLSHQRSCADIPTIKATAAATQR